jgi:hypothetical protein
MNALGGGLRAKGISQATIETIETMIVVMKLLITQSSNNDDHESEMDQCDIIEAQRQPRSLRTPSVS